ncbi:MAG: protein-glutamate O-methyltransferase CheR [Actinobacteria bacterium]|nr:protein-glutamate O-methyltransferase CheR [Actinomycetota bacterium]
MALTASEFAFISSLVYREAAIVLGPGKEYLVEARLQPLSRHFGAGTVSELVQTVQRRADSEAVRRIVDALTTNETSWFRDREPFTALTDVVLPELIAARSNARQIRLWSAACSSGQEPYTLAMILRDHLPAGWRTEMLASDISTEMLARAEAGRFSQLEVNRGLPAALLVRYFEREGTSWRVADSLRQGISFRPVNLAAPLPSMAPFDVVFLRNVLIYFDVETKRAVLKRVAALLRPDGWLFLGSAESTIGIDDGFERVVVGGRTPAYRLRSATTAPAGASGMG